MSSRMMANLPVPPGVLAPLAGDSGSCQNIKEAGMAAQMGQRQRAGRRRVAWRLMPGGVVAAMVVALAVPSVAAAGGAAAATGGAGGPAAVISGPGLRARGDNTFGQFGNGTSSNNSTTPVSVHLAQGTTVTAISAGCEHSLALTSTGQVLSWGDNGAGQLGDGTTTASDVPVQVSMPGNLKATAVGAGPGANVSLAIVNQPILLPAPAL